MTETLVQSPILTLFVVIGLGYLLGEINFWGFRLGVAGVLFVGLAIGSLSPAIALPEMVATLGLIIFVYTIGIQSGPSFFANLRTQGSRSLLAVGVLVGGALLALGLSWWLPASAGRIAGLYCGALTNTPALAASQERARELARQANLSEEETRRRVIEPVVAYSIAYPFGVIGVLLAIQIARRVSKNQREPSDDAPEILVRDFVVRNPGVAGQTLEQILRLHRDPGFVISRIQHEGQVELAKPDTPLAIGDVVAAVGDEESLERAKAIFGEPADVHLELDRSRLDYRRVFVSSSKVVGRRLRDLDLERSHNCTITRLRRGDVDIVPTPDTRLEMGDRVRVLTERSNFQHVTELFGDSMRAASEADFGSVALGMVLGVLLGMMPIPIPGAGTIKLGLAGGPLLMALALGYIERTGRIAWTLPFSANLTLRQIGLVLFLAAVGTRAGYSFFSTLQAEGALLLVGGAAITAAVAMFGFVAGGRMGIPFDELAGIVSGIQTQPACLAYANSLTRNDRPNLGYASVYPAAMIAKIVLAQLLLTFGMKVT